MFLYYYQLIPANTSVGHNKPDTDQNDY